MIVYDPPEDSEADHSFEADVVVLQILPALERLLITKPCQHPKTNAISVKKITIGSGVEEVVLWKDDETRIWKIEEDICTLRAVDYNLASTICHYLPVADNHLAQWAALSSMLKTNEDGHQTGEVLAIFQDKACLSCTRDQGQSHLMSRKLSESEFLFKESFNQNRLYVL